MKSGKIITLSQATNEAKDVQSELYQIGLWNEGTKLWNAHIYVTRIPLFTMASAGAIFTHGVSSFYKFFGFEVGHIYIPKWVLSQGFWQNRGSLRDIIRHEYGHVLAHYYPELIQHCLQFERVFGGHYFDACPSSMNRNSYISDYACTMPCEDFAETFMVFVRRKGKKPIGMNDEKLIKKWDYIQAVCKKISKY